MIEMSEQDIDNHFKKVGGDIVFYEAETYRDIAFCPYCNSVEITYYTKEKKHICKGCGAIF